MNKRLVFLQPLTYPPWLLYFSRVEAFSCPSNILDKRHLFPPKRLIVIRLARKWAIPQMAALTGMRACVEHRGNQTLSSLPIFPLTENEATPQAEYVTLGWTQVERE